MRRALSIALLLSLPFAERAIAAGPTYVVNDTADAPDAIPGDGKCETAVGNGKCTLHAAIDEAEHDLPIQEALILLPPTTALDPIILNGGLRPVTVPMTIQGAGTTATTVRSPGTSTVFAISVLSGVAVTFKAMTITGAQLLSALGGAVQDQSCGAHISMEDVLITDCTAASGGAIYSNGALTMTRCEIKSCHATDIPPSNGRGGAIFVSDVCPSTVVLRDCTIDGNTATLYGGGLFVAAGEVHLVNSTVSGNVAAAQGGGVYVYGGQVYLENATVAGNTAQTFAGGGGIYNASAAAAANFENSILASNREVNGQTLVEGNCGGLLTSLGHNIYGVDDMSHCSVQGGGVTVADPGLGDLAANGGPTPTRAIGAGSPAIDGGDPTGCKSQLVTLTTDQRGVMRPLGSACDIGAYERSSCGDVNGDGAVDVVDVFFLINYLFAGGAIPPGLANVNEDAVTDVADVFYLINALFAGGSAPVCPGT